MSWYAKINEVGKIQQIYLNSNPNIRLCPWKRFLDIVEKLQYLTQKVRLAQGFDSTKGHQISMMIRYNPFISLLNAPLSNNRSDRSGHEMQDGHLNINAVPSTFLGLVYTKTEVDNHNSLKEKDSEMTDITLEI